MPRKVPSQGTWAESNVGPQWDSLCVGLPTEVPDALLSLEIGLCLNMRSLPWYVQANPNTFFPRCYGLCTESEKQEFLGE